MFVERLVRKFAKPQRGGMIGHAEFFRDTKQVMPQTIAPRWGLKALVTVSYNHCVPPGLKRTANRVETCAV